MGFNVEQLLNDIKVDYNQKEYTHDGSSCVRYELGKCFFDESHTNNDACIFQYENGNIAYKCQHDSCKDKAWEDVRTHLESELGVTLGKYWSKQPSKDNQQETESSLEFTTYFDICAKPVERKSIITGFLDENDPTIISGNGGVGKSMFIFYLAYYLANPEINNNMLFGKFLVPKPRTSLFIQSENTQNQVNQRLNKMAGNDPNNREALKRIISPVINGDVLTTGRTFKDKIFQQWVIDLIRKVEDQEGFKMDLLFFDPLISFISSDENDSAIMRKDLDGVTQIALAADITPVIVHHNKKDGKGYRGSSAIFDWARSLISLSPELISEGEEDVKCIKVKHEKCNNFEMFDPFRLKMMGNNTFTHIDSAISPKEREQNIMIVKALTDLGGKADSQTQLAGAYREIIRG